MLDFCQKLGKISNYGKSDDVFPYTEYQLSSHRPPILPESIMEVKEFRFIWRKNNILLDRDSYATMHLPPVGMIFDK